MTSKARKPYRGDGVAVPAVAPTALPPEPSGEHAIVQVRVVHPVFGRDPVLDRMVTNWVPRGWIPQRPLTWRELVVMGGGQAPTVLDPREVTS